MTAFLTHSTNIVKNFLQTAVFLDDRAEMACTSRKEVTPSLIHDPNMGEMVAAKQTKDTEDSEAHRLDAETIINTFMENGIVCSVLRCTEENKESQKANYIKLMKKADLIVLDWDIHRDGGKYITEIIQNLLNEQGKIQPFRSIIIYTAELLDGVKQGLERDISLVFNAADTSTTNQYTHVSLYNKPDSKAAIPDRSVPFNELIEKCIFEFTTSFHGIVPNVAMAAIAEVRAKTHDLLGVLNKELDLAYLSHKSLLESPDDAADLLTNIIAEEIQSLITTEAVSKHAKYDVVQHYPIIDGKIYEGIAFKECIETGSSILQPKKDKLNKDIKAGQYTEKWSQQNPAQKAKDSDNRFVQLTSLITNYTPQDYLAFGVIIESDTNSEEKYLCLQPSCDTVRLTENTRFLFLKLTKSKANYFDFILDSSDKYTYSYNKKDREYIDFSVNPANTNIKFIDGKITDTNQKKYKYSAMVKRLHAQRIAQEFSASLSRVGIDESEYLRRNNNKNRCD